MNYIDNVLYQGLHYGDNHYLPAPISNIVSLFLKVVVDGAGYAFPSLEGRCFSYLKGKTYGQCTRLAIPYLGVQWSKGTQEARRSFDFEMIKNHPECFALPAFDCYRFDYEMIAAAILALKENKKPLPTILWQYSKFKDCSTELVKVDQKMIRCLDFTLMEDVEFLVKLFNEIDLFLTKHDDHESLRLKFLENMLLEVPSCKVVEFFKNFSDPLKKDLQIVKKFTGRHPGVVKHLKIPLLNDTSEQQKVFFTSICADFNEEETLKTIEGNPEIFPFIKRDFQKTEFIKKAIFNERKTRIQYYFHRVWEIFGYVDLTSLDCDEKSFFKDILRGVFSSDETFFWVDDFVIEMLKKNDKIFVECLEELGKEEVEEIKVKNRSIQVLDDLKNNPKKILKWIKASEEVFSWVNPELKKDVEFIGLCVIENAKIFEKITINDFSECYVKVKVKKNKIIVDQKERTKYPQLPYMAGTNLLSLIKNEDDLLQQLEPIYEQENCYVVVDSVMQYKLLFSMLLNLRTVYSIKILCSCDPEAFRNNSILLKSWLLRTFWKGKKYPAFVKRLLLQALKWTEKEQEKICEALIKIDVDIFITELSLLVKEKKMTEGDFSCLTETNLLRDKRELSLERMNDISMGQFVFKQILDDEGFMSENQHRREAYEKIVNCVSNEELQEFLKENSLQEEEKLRYLFIGQVHLFKQLMIKHLPNELECLQFAGTDIFKYRGFLLEIAKNDPEAITRATVGPLGRMVKKAEMFFRCERISRGKSKIMIPIFLRKKIFACMFVPRRDSDLSFTKN